MIKSLTTVFSIILISTMTALAQTGAGGASQQKNPLLLLAKLQIDSAQVESYKVYLKEGIESSIRVEPGCLTLYAVYEKDHPTHVTIFEVYADTAAYKAHLQTPHYKKYKNATKGMVKSLEESDVVPVMLGAKGK